MTGFEGHGDFYGTPYEAYVAHQAAKGNLPSQRHARTTHERQLLEARLQTALDACEEAAQAVNRAVAAITEWKAS